MRFAALPVVTVAMIPLMIAACSPSEPQTAETQPMDAPVVATTDTATNPAALQLGAVNLTQPLRALGNEPGWSAEVANNTLSYTTMEATQPLTGTVQAPQVAGDTAVWRTTLSDGSAAVLTLTNKQCTDGMSDRTYALTARLEVAGKASTGCAASVAGLQAASESGHVQ